MATIIMETCEQNMKSCEFAVCWKHAGIFNSLTEARQQIGEDFGPDPAFSFKSDDHGSAWYYAYEIGRDSIVVVRIGRMTIRNNADRFQPFMHALRAVQDGRV